MDKIKLHEIFAKIRQPLCILENGVISWGNLDFLSLYKIQEKDIIGNLADVLFMDKEDNQIDINQIGNIADKQSIIEVKSINGVYAPKKILVHTLGESTEYLLIFEDITDPNIRGGKPLLSFENIDQVNLPNILLMEKALEKTPVMIALVDQVGEIIFANESLTKSLNYSKNQITNLTVFDIEKTLKNNSLAAFRNYWQYLKNEPELKIGTIFLDKDGDEHPVELTANLVRYQDKEFVWIYAESLVKGDRVHQSIVSGKESYETLFNVMLNGFAFFRIQATNDSSVVDFICNDVNAAFESITGVDKKKLIGKSISEIFPNKALEWTKAFDQVLKEKQSIKLDYSNPSTGCFYHLYAYHAQSDQLALFFINVTDQILIERAKRENEAHFRNYFEQGAVGMAVSTSNQQIIVVNQKLCDILGYTRKEMLTISWNEIFFSECRKAINNLFSIDLVEDKKESHNEVLFSRKDGTLVDVRLTSKPILIEDGYHYFLLVEDISEYKKTRKKLIESRMMMRMVMDQIPQAVFWKDNESRYLGANLEFLRQNNLASLDELIGKSDFDLHPKELAKSFIEADQQLIKEDIKILNLEEMQKKKDGSVVWVQVNKVPLINADGERIGILGISTDITDMRKINEDLRHERDVASALMMASSAINSILDLDHIMGEILDHLEKVIPCDACNVMLFKDKKFVPVAWKGYKDLSTIQLSVDETSTVQRIFKYSASIIIADIENESDWIKVPESEWVKSAMSAPIFVQEDIIGILTVDSSQPGYFSDEQIPLLEAFARLAAAAIEKSNLYENQRVYAEELEKRVLERTIQLEETNKELEAFSYSVSHDLRAPLRAVTGFSKILTENFADTLNFDARKYLDLVQQNAHNMSQLIDDLLRLSRLTRQPLRIQTVDIKEMAQAIFDEMIYDYKGRKVDFVVQDIPPCEADSGLLRQVLVNLIGNALKFTRNKPTAEITVGSNLENGRVIYFISDNGVGFDVKYSSKAFDLFQRLHSEKDFEGTGAGLAIAKRILHRHGGSIWADGAPDQGATFYFSLEEQ
ncbi:MAG: PAS domain S-box protein [Anaerolineales bacterium]|nr:PAS domain S-box protein [Anaerolineales bacterium]